MSTKTKPGVWRETNHDGWRQSLWRMSGLALMRRPHVYERSAPRPSRHAYHEPSHRAVSTAAGMAEVLFSLVEKAEASGLSALAALLKVALREAEEQVKLQASQGSDTNSGPL